MFLAFMGPSVDPRVATLKQSSRTQEKELKEERRSLFFVFVADAATYYYCVYQSDTGTVVEAGVEDRCENWTVRHCGNSRTRRVLSPAAGSLLLLTTNYHFSSLLKSRRELVGPRCHRNILNRAEMPFRRIGRKKKTKTVAGPHLDRQPLI